jgi:hypothetical protein
LVGESEGRILLGRPRSRWKDNNKIDPREIGWDDMVWIHMGQGSVVGSCEQENEPSASIKCWDIPSYPSSCWLLREDSAP